MKRKLLLLSVTTCILAFGLTGCGHEHIWEEATCLTPKTCAECGETEGEVADHKWVEATCEKAKYCEVCGETDGEPLGHEWVEADYEKPKTCSLCGLTEGEALPAPYCVENNITFQNLQDMDLEFAMAFSEDKTVVDIDGMWIEKDMAHYSFGEIVSSPSEQAGYIDVIIPVQVTLSATIYEDTTIHSGPFGWNLSYPSFDIGDYYTGLTVPERSTYTDSNGSDSVEYSKDFEWDGNTYSIGYSKIVDTISSDSGWNTDSNISSKTYDYILNHTYTITIPENFDGLVLSVKKASTEVSFEGKDGEAVVDKEEHFLDEHEADYFFFYRLSDMINN